MDDQENKSLQIAIQAIKDEGHYELAREVRAWLQRWAHQLSAEARLDLRMLIGPESKAE